jgi:NADP-dependent 3-hydroxy acid dehydrogenase YdfG
MAREPMAEDDKPPVAVVTGAGRGIGRAIALELAAHGFDLCLAARTSVELAETRSQSGLEAKRSLIVLADLADEDSADALIETALEHFGRIDVLVNNAGWAPARTPLAKMALAELDRIIAVNLRAPIALARLALPQMIKRGAGAIVNIASMAARNNAPGEAAYAAAKAGLIAFTHACFAEVRDAGVKVAVIVPGLVDTSLIPNNKRMDRSLMLRPEEVARAVLQVIDAPAGVCPIELAIEPQRTPIR